MKGSSRETFALRYGDLEKLLTTLLGSTDKVVVSRFRKLRPKFAADGLLTETGNRVSYDLTRVLAICAVYQLNSLSIPQGEAVNAVVANWPEIARASLKAWLDQSPDDGEPTTGPAIVRIFIDSMSGEQSVSWASNEASASTGLPHVMLDLSPVVDAISILAKTGEKDEVLSAAFHELEQTFGCAQMREEDAPILPQRADSDFFGTGPYFDRARALLGHEPDAYLHPNVAPRLQAFLDYLEEPAPIDSWKRYIGSSSEEPRLVHILAAWGADLGLQPRSFGAEILKAACRRDRAYALTLIKSGEEVAAQLVERVGHCEPK